MAFADLVHAMIVETRTHITEIQEYAKDSNISGVRRHAVREVLHTEGLRLDMLQRVLRDWQEEEG